MELRPVAARDREALSALLRAIVQFRPDEVAVAEELIDAAIRDPAGTGYECIVAVEQGALAGYVCFGPTPMTLATWDLYWIVVLPSLQGHGVGKRLFGAFSDAIRLRGGRQIRVETSSQESYAATFGFYERLGFGVAGRLRDFYAQGDDLLIFYRQL